MTWTKLDDSTPDDLLDLSDSAFRLHVAALCYANRLGLDGQIPKARIGLIPVPARTRRKAVVRELVAAGLWSESADGVTLNDFLRDQPSAEEVALQRRWDVLRQQIRFVSGPDRAEKQADLRRDADAVRDALHAARNHRKATYSQVSSLVNHYVPSRPVSDPSRPAPSEDEDGDDRRRLSAPLGGAQPPENEKPPQDWEGLPFVVTYHPDKPIEVCFRCRVPLSAEEIDSDDLEMKPIKTDGRWGMREMHKACPARYPGIYDQEPKQRRLPVVEAFR